ncbi:alpha/beta hydrolase family protein [Corynebacterium sp. Q4381]|uniref:alpha/beta hydrolase n=1 Tax=Corynebacterium sp. Marseille-Q4381 TaxID=3121597 RepID=UPI002FE64BF6
MKHTRRVLTTVAAIALVAGAAPAAVHHRAAEDAQGLQTIARIQPADEQVEVVAEASEPADLDEIANAAAESGAAGDAGDAGDTDETTADTTVVEAETVEVVEAQEVAEAPVVNGASVPDGDGQGLTNVVETALQPEATGEDADNMPEAVTAQDAADSLGEVRELTAAPKDYNGEDQYWFSQIRRYRGGEAVEVYSQAMDRYIPVALIRATDQEGKPVEDAPTYYLLNGAGGSEQNTDWISQAATTVQDVLENEPVNVVIPMEGAFSYYVDWLTKPEENKYFKGEQKWSTFLAHELRPSIEDYTKASDKRAVSGFSMAATSVLLLAEHNPDMFDAVGSFSGCAATSTPLPNFFVGLTVNRGSAGTGRVTPENLWGPRGSEYNRYNDALVMADNLKDSKTKFYVSAGTGLPGQTDMLGYLKENQTSSVALQQALTLWVEGGAIEAAMNACTHDFNTKARSVGADVYFNRRAVGTHSWPIWQDDLKVSWDKVIKPALLG